jgi:hypothetical protein
MKQVVLLLVLLTAIIFAAAPVAEASSVAGVLYLRVAAGARAAGMGEAFVSIADDATATYWNPAGLGNAPLAGTLRTRYAPKGTIADVVTLERQEGGLETWVIADGHLYALSGEEWKTGAYYQTSSDQNLTDFLKTIVTTDDSLRLQTMAQKVIDANCAVTREEVESFIETLRTKSPEDYTAKDELLKGLDTLQSAYDGCLLVVDRFKDLQSKLKDGLKDSTLTATEVDRMTYALERATQKYLPSQLMVPFETGITGKPSCLAKTGKYLWVGTDDGLYRLSGLRWARFTTADSLPSNAITALAGYEDNLMIGTSGGLVRYAQGTFQKYANLPAAPVARVLYKYAELGYAVIGDELFRFDGKSWDDSYSYTVRLDDNMEKLVDMAAIYHTFSEAQFLRQRIEELNRNAVPPTALRKPGDTLIHPLDPSALAAVNAAMKSNMPVAATDTLAGKNLLGGPPDTLAGKNLIGGPADTLTHQLDPSLTSKDSAAIKANPPAPGDSVPDTTVAVAPTKWLSEGNKIKLPFGKFRYGVTALEVDQNKVVWVGTAAGLMSFDGKAWTRYGYNVFTVAAGDSTTPGKAMTAQEIAEKVLPGADSSKVALLAANINDYNDLSGSAVEPGQVVYVYNSNTGSAIRSVGMVYGDLVVGTEYGLIKKTDEGWEPVDIEGLDHKQVVSSYDYNGQAYYASSTGITNGTKGRSEFILMHVKWLPNLTGDMYYEFLSFVHNIRGMGTIGFSVIFLTYGAIDFTDANGTQIGTGHPFEITGCLSYGTSLTNSLKWGMSVKIIHSRLSPQGAGAEKGSGIATDFAFDTGILYKLTRRLQFGAAVTNIGPNISYIDAAQADPLPRNLGVGLSYRLIDSPYNRLIVQGELNKILTKLNKGIGKELEFAIRHVGMEYWYANLIALRAGYMYDKDGQVKHFTFGAGLQYQSLRADFAYIPSSTDSPLANTLRISLTGMF